MPPSALVQPGLGCVSIPEKWTLVLDPELFIVGETERQPTSRYVAVDVTRDMLVGKITEDIEAFLRVAPGTVSLVEVMDMQTGDHRELDCSRTAKDTDLFNIADRLVVVTVAGGGGDGLGARQALARLSAANNKPRAPKHLELVNGALGLGSWGSLGSESRLNEIDAKDIQKLKRHLQKVNETPCRVCYNVSRLTRAVMSLDCVVP